MQIEWLAYQGVGTQSNAMSGTPMPSAASKKIGLKEGDPLPPADVNFSG
jgi:hypothetical protein